MAVDDMLGVVTEALVETGADEAWLLETADEADELAEELPEYETAELEAEPDETEDDPLWVGMLEEADETVTMTEPEADSNGIAPDEMKVTKVDSVEVLGTTVVYEVPIRVEGRDTETVNECVEVASVIELTPTELLGVLEGVETGG